MFFSEEKDLFRNYQKLSMPTFCWPTYLVKDCKCILFLIASLGSRSINFFVPDVAGVMDMMRLMDVAIF